MSDTFQTHGAFSWSEMQTADIAGARQFYSDVIGWELEEMDLPNGKYTVIKVGGRPVGGIAARPETNGGSDAWVGYITVDDVDLRTRKAKDAGGKVLTAPMDAPGVGRMSTIEDPSGAVVRLITYEAKDKDATA